MPGIRPRACCGQTLPKSQPLRIDDDRPSDQSSGTSWRRLFDLAFAARSCLNHIAIDAQSAIAAALHIKALIELARTARTLELCLDHPRSRVNSTSMSSSITRTPVTSRIATHLPILRRSNLGGSGGVCAARRRHGNQRRAGQRLARHADDDAAAQCAPASPKALRDRRARSTRIRQCRARQPRSGRHARPSPGQKPSIEQQH